MTCDRGTSSKPGCGFVARPTNTDLGDSGSYQCLCDHLVRVAEKARELAEPFGGGNFAYYLGLIHDIGKAQPKWQDWIRNDRTKGKNKRPIHNAAGACMLRGKIAPNIVFGHHGGPRDPGEIQELRQGKHNDMHFEEHNFTLSDDVLVKIHKDLPRARTVTGAEAGVQDGLAMEHFARMVEACIVNADCLDAERAQNGAKAIAREYQHVAWSELQQRLATYRAGLSSKAKLSGLRGRVYDAALKKATGPKGVYRLTAPTGSGKTLATMGFALKHAETHGMTRIIYALPFMTILDEMSETFVTALDPKEDTTTGGIILKHYTEASYMDDEDKKQHCVDECMEKIVGCPSCHRYLASETWDKQIILTTNVQLFDSLFSNKNSRIRKLSNLPNSVIILDEYQTLPMRFKEPIDWMIRELTTRYGCTVLLSSATPQSMGKWNGKSVNFPMTDIVPMRTAIQHAKQAKRVKYDYVRHPLSWERVVARVKKTKQCMVVLNTRPDAVTLFRLLEGENTFHLSTFMCMSHRKSVLKEIHRRLDNGEPCYVVTTQVVEAGVNLDFPVVMRARGPLSSIIQAAGRCNREGTLKKPGKVVIFIPVDDNQPHGEYKAAVKQTESALNMQRDVDAYLHNPRNVEKFYNEMFEWVTPTDRKGIQEMRRKLQFVQVGRAFHIIPDQDRPVVIPEFHDWNGRVVKCPVVNYERMRRNDYRVIAPFIVNVKKWEVDALVKAGVLDRHEDIYVWKAEYDPKIGIGVEKLLEPKEWKPSHFKEFDDDA